MVCDTERCQSIHKGRQWVSESEPVIIMVESSMTER